MSDMSESESLKSWRPAVSWHKAQMLVWCILGKSTCECEMMMMMMMMCCMNKQVYRCLVGTRFLLFSLSVKSRVQHDVMSYNAMVCHVTSSSVMSNTTCEPHCIMLWYVILHYMTSCHVTPCYILWGHVSTWHVILCSVTLSYITLCFLLSFTWRLLFLSINCTYSSY